MTKVLGISGSLRRGSYNSALLRAATRLMPADATLEVASIRGIPLYDGDVEAQGIPATVTQLKEAIVGADGVLLVTPEYNNSIPGVFKNTIDWLSRPSADIKRVFGGRPFALIGASPGPFGTVQSQAAWLPVLRTLGTQPWFNGETFGWADLSVVPYINGSSGQSIGPEASSKLGQWQARANARPTSSATG